jgi:hypothetical protein
VPALAQVLAAVVVDHVLTGSSPPADRAARERALRPLEDLRSRHHLPVIVVEHVAAGHRGEARAVARTLADRGIVPWVSIGAFGLGLGLREPVPRRILGIYDGAEEAFLPSTEIHRRAAMPLEHLGYVVDYVDVRAGLPPGDIGARYAGIVTWFNDDDIARAQEYERWLITQIDRGVRVAIVGRMGVPATSELLRHLGLSAEMRAVTPPVTLVTRDRLTGFEAEPTPLCRDLPAWRTADGATGAQVHVRLRDARGQMLTPVVTARWGGMALNPYVLESGIENRLRWILDPFAFFVLALDLPALPVPDPTTENGTRLATVHIDGDGFASRAELPQRPFSGEVIRDFLRRYPLPTTVSIIEGETSRGGLYRDLAPRLESIARDIFRLPNVEVASHSFSHPFDWARAGGARLPYDSEGIPGEGDNEPGDVHLPIKGYKYSVKREVAGSVQYIDQRLAPAGKPVKVFLWSGSAMPGEDALQEAAALRLANMNGTNGDEPRDAPLLSQVPSLGRFVGPHFQVYAQGQNENVYTREWHGPFYGFRSVIEMFRFTESPRRLKPIDLYYHFYSGTKAASIAALEEVYRWVTAQDIVAIHASEMTAKATDFARARMARNLDGSWELRGLTALRTVRLDRRLGWPDLDASSGVVGVNDIPQGRYVSLSGEPSVRLALAATAPAGPHLVSANAPLRAWVRSSKRVGFRLRGGRPVEAVVGGCSPLGIAAGGARVRVDDKRRQVRLVFRESDSGQVVVECR